MSYDLIMSDPHVHPGQNLERFDWLGRMIMEERPDRLICIGDLATLDSLTTHITPGSRHDRERPLLSEEGVTCRDAIRRMMQPYNKYDQRQMTHKHRAWPMEWIFVKGNHEERFETWANNQPAASSAIDIDCLLGIDRFDIVVPYRRSITRGFIDYTHVPMTKMGRPMGGVNVCRTVCLQSRNHTFFGHSHTMQYSSLGLLGGNNAVRVAYNCPAFMERGNVEDYAIGTQTGWSYGVTRVFPSDDPTEAPDIEYVSIRRLKQLYS